MFQRTLVLPGVTDRSLYGTLVLLLGLAVCSSSLAAQKRIVVTTLHAENRSRAETLDQLWDQASIVIEGLIEGSTPADVVVSGDTVVQTAFSVKVHEVFKRSPNLREPGASVILRRAGGDRDRGSYIERIVTDDFPPFVVGERYVFFLRERLIDGQLFYVTSTIGADGIFKFVGNSLQTPGKRAVTRELAQQGPIALRQALRGKGGRP